MNENTMERLWNEYREINVRPDCDPETLKTIAVIFHTGALMMLREMTEIQQDVYKQLSVEFKKFDEEIKDAQNTN